MKKRFLSLIIALAMMVGVFTPLLTSAEGESTDPNAVTNSVTLHKLMMTKDELKAWDSEAIEKAGYNGTQDVEALKKLLTQGHSAHEVPDVFFAWQVKGKETTKVGEKDVKQYIKKAADSTETLYKPEIGQDGNPVLTTNIDEAFGGKTSATGIKFDTSKLKGTFLIQEIKEKSTYKNDKNVIVDQKAVPVDITLPLVNDKGTVVDAHVYPKNTEDKPEIDKNFKKAADNEKELEKADGFPEAADGAGIGVGANYDNYQKDKATAKVSVGDKVPYEVKTKIAAGTSYENLTWNDIMTNGLTYNKDLKIEASNGVTFTEADYELKQDDNGFRLKMHESGLKKIEAVTKAEEQKDVEITLTYSATVNGTAKVDNPEKNNVTLEYGHKPGKNLEEKPVTPKDGNLEVVKKFEEGAKTDGLKIAYTLKSDNKEVATVALDNSMTSGSINLGNGIIFEITGAFKGTFKGLPEGTNWTISERVAGYNPEYAETNEAGKVTITNKEDKENPTPLEPTTPQVVTGGKKFVKTNQDGSERLAGAKFVVKNEKGDKYLAVKSVDTVQSEKEKLTKAKEALDAAVKAYNERKDDTNKETLAEAIKTAQGKYNEAFKTAGTRYEWVAKDAKNVTLVTLASNKDGQFQIEGLAYGKYKLEEIEAPKGYATQGDVEFTIAKGETTDVNIKYVTTDKAENAKQIINKKVTIPQTGGIGTIIFTAIGLAIMASAIIAIKKRQATEAR
ncbi:pilin N-terminal domain-containing protein [Finegoldia magna]|uniref:pilin N-terminal domain-containing protein n=1 Tax=Finegoldia magna TaxID=1260 RepID=UPI00324810CA